MGPKRTKVTKKAESAAAPSRVTRATRNTKQVDAPDHSHPTEVAREDDAPSDRRTARQSRIQPEPTLSSERSAPASRASPGGDSQRASTAPDEQEEEAREAPRKNVRKRPTRLIKTTAQTAEQRLALEGLRERMRADVRANAQGVSLEQQQHQLDEERAKTPEARKVAPAGPINSPSPRPQTHVPSTITRPPQSVLKAQSTPGVESSVLALANFRRRPRQPSLLQMVQQGVLDHTSPGQDTTDFTLDQEEDDFEPHDESTPLQVAKAQQAAVTAPPAQAPRNDDDDLYTLSPQPKQTRKRKSDEMDGSAIQVIRSSPLRSESPVPSELSLPEDLETVPATAPESDDEEAETSEPRGQDLGSDTLADPISSSPPPMLPRSPIALAKPTSRRGRPHRAHQNSETRSSKPQQEAGLSTAALRALLPKRRERAKTRDDFDLPTSSDADRVSSDEDSDHDELASRSRRKGQPKNSKASTRRQATAKKTPGKAASKVVGGKSSTNNQARQKPEAQSSTTGKAKRTYLRASNASDKENASSSSLTELTSDEDVMRQRGEDTGDTSLETVAPKKQKSVKSSELQAAKAKFAEIDQWEMEFESAPSLGAAGGNSSPWR